METVYISIYCEKSKKQDGIPSDYDVDSVNWTARESNVAFGLDSYESIRDDKRDLISRGYHILAAGGFIGVWPTKPVVLSEPDELGGVRVGFEGSTDPYTCQICKSPIRMVLPKPPEEVM
jgi:hypothetical protein